jgi:hypothetical protein
MEAIYKLNTREIDIHLMDSIKKLFGSKDVIIQISTINDETSYLLASKANKTHLMESIASEPEMVFTGNEFENHAKKLSKDHKQSQQK